jgi:NtrC-family two-component system response regulator AlgB
MVRDHLFREDLFYRLSVVDLCLPALRHRTEDVLLLAGEFVSSFGKAHGRKVTGWDEEVERALVTHSWPGNVRELAHSIERAVLLAPGRVIRLEHLPERVKEKSAANGASLDHLTLAELEERHIRRALALNLAQDETARRLGIDPSTLWRKRKKYGL